MESKKKVWVFDLDDTLYKEIDYLKSAYGCISRHSIDVDPGIVFDRMMSLYKNKKRVFESIIDEFIFDVSLEEMIKIYDTHPPSIELLDSCGEFLDSLFYKDSGLSVITDGRSVTQRNKLEGLGVIDRFSRIIISEEVGSSKPSLLNYQLIQEHFGNDCEFFYVGDNVIKDFVTPNTMGWTTICLMDDGRNIHSQMQPVPTNDHLPQFWLADFKSMMDRNC